MLKNLFNSGKCLLGFHQGDWQYESPGSCIKFQVCNHCGKRSTKTEHTWNEWAYKQDGDCQQVRVCLRCQENETQMVHVWSADAYYKTDGECTAVNYCERCGEQKLYGTVHQWEQWVYTSPESCHQTQKCGRCGTLGGASRVEHGWDNWQYSAFYNGRVRICQHCGSMALLFEATTRSLPMMQDVDVLFKKFAQVQSVREISALMRANGFLFDQPTNPVLTAYLHFIDIHMPEGERKEIYKALGQGSSLWGVIGDEALLSELDGMVQQPGQNPWSLANAATISAAKKKSQPSSDKRLIGHWRFTEVMGGGGLSSVTDYHRIFEENGHFQEFSHARSSLGTDRRTSPLHGTWSSQNNIITIQFADGTSSEIPYHLEENTLAFSNHRDIWQRV